MKKIKLVVFDIAGTTVHDEMFVSKAVAAAMNEFGYVVAAIEVQPIMGYKKPTAIKMLLNIHEPDAAKITEKLIDDIHTRFVHIIAAFYKSHPDLRPIDGVEEVMTALKTNGIAVALDTGFSKEITDIIVGRLGWLQSGLVQYVVSSDEVPEGRPAPYMIQKIMSEAGVLDAEQVIKVGDTEVDVNEGKNANCLYSIAVTTGAFTKEALMPYNPDFIINNMRELLPIITRHQMGIEV